MNEKRTKNGKRIGRPPRHGGYSLLAKRGDVPECRRYVREYLEGVRAGLVRDLGPKEGDLTAAQLTLINHVISKVAITRLIEERLAETGIFNAAGELDPALGKFFLIASNSLRLDLQALGINTRKREEILDLGRYIAAKDAEAQAPGPEAEGVETGPHSETSSDSPGHQAIVDDDKHKGAGDGKE